MALEYCVLRPASCVLRPTHGVLVLSCPSAVLRVCGVLGHVAPVHRCGRVVVLCLGCPGRLGSCSPVRPPGVLCCMCGVLGHLVPAHRGARWVCCVACAVSWDTWLLFTSARARFVVLRVRCPGPLGSCSPVCLLGVVCCLCGVLVLLAPVHGCARSLGCVVCAVSWTIWLLVTSVPPWFVVLPVRCPGPLGSCSPVRPLSVLCCVCGVLGYLAPVHRCAPWVCSVACAVSWATGVPARMLCCACGVLGHFAPVHRCARSVCCVACAVSRATWLLFTGVPTPYLALLVRCPGPLGSRSPVCPVGVLFCVCCVLGHLALFTGVPARCVVLRVRCPGPVGSCSPLCPLRPLLCLCGVLGHLAPVHRSTRSVCFVACALSWASWLLLTGVPAPSFALLVRCPGPLGSCSPVCPLGVLFCVCGVLGHLAPVHRCARSVCCVACAVSLASWLLFTGASAPSFALLVRCARPLGSCSPVRALGVLCCLCGVLGHLAAVHRCARSVCCVACAVSLATWLFFTGAPALSFALAVRCPGPLGSCLPVCPLRVLFCVCGVLGHLAPVHRCARSVCCGACAVSWASWLLFTGVPAPSFALLVRCPRPLGSCSPVRPLGVLFFAACGVLGHLALVHRCARSVCCVACAVSWATWLLFTGVPAPSFALLVRCPGPLGSCSPVCPLGVLLCLCVVLGLLAPVDWCARSVGCVARAVSLATWLLVTGVPARGIVLRVRCPGPLGSCSPVCPLCVLCFWLRVRCCLCEAPLRGAR